MAKLPPFDLDSLLPPATERQRQVIHMLRDGMPMPVIAKQLGCAVETVKSDRARVLRSVHAQGCWYYGLGTRSRNCFIEYNIVDRAGVEDFVVSGKWRRARNFGFVCLQEVRAWLGWEPHLDVVNEPELVRRCVKNELVEATAALHYIRVLSLRQSGVVSYKEIGDATRHLAQFSALPADIQARVKVTRKLRFDIE